MPTKGSQIEIDASGSLGAYFEYNKVLRTWFVAFGVGGPALLLSNEKLTKLLSASGDLRLVSVLFLVGGGAQVVVALINKVANWYVHSKYHQVGVTPTFKHHAAEWIANQFWIDVLADIVSVCVFGWASWLLLTVFVSVP